MKINKISIQNSCINNRINKSNKKADVFHKYNSSIYNSKNLYSKLGSISFGYKLKGAKNSHLDYFGANVDPVTKKTTFRVYSTKDKIELQIANKDHYKKYWENLSKEEENEIGLETYLMKKEGRVFEIRPEKIIKEGMLYRYKITDKDGNVSYAKDPRTYYQPHDAMGWSGVYNQNSYVWHDKKWQDGLDERKIKRTKDINDWGVESNMVISEKHIGTLGGYENAKKEIDKISKEGICNTVYFLPVGEFFGEYNIGYDEVDKFAPESSYGTPDELKSLVDYAHQKGINVILDVVPNHFGFIGSSVGQFADAQDETKNTGWGAALKFKDKDGEYMRKYMSDMMINWLVNYHFDGLRIDATEKLDYDPALKYFASEIRGHNETKNSILLSEHLEKTRKLAQPLYEDEIKDPIETYKRASDENLAADRLGYDIQYTYDFKNTLMALTLNMNIYDCPPSIDDLAKEYELGNRFYDEQSKNLENPKAKNSYVYFNMHDEYNVFGGVRPVVRALAWELKLPYEKTLISPDGMDKAPYLRAEKLLENYLLGNYSDNEINIKEFEKAYKNAQRKNRLMLSLTFMHPANKGFSMGDETGELTPFRYFARYESDEIKKNVDKEKGYSVGEDSFKKSSKIYNKIEDKNLSKTVTMLSKDFTKLICENGALKKGDFNNVISYPIDNETIFIHRWDNSGSDIFAIGNFSDTKKTINDIKGFPDGIWSEVLNTDNKKYGGDGITNDKKIQRGDIEINLAPNSLCVFKREG